MHLQEEERHKDMKIHNTEVKKKETEEGKQYT